MRCIIRYLCVGLWIAGGAAAQTALTWQQVQERFRAANPNLLAGDLTIQESRAAEITAYLRPNPNFTITSDQLAFFNGNPYRPFQFTEPLVSFDYLHERQHKRELRLQSAKEGTAISESQQQGSVSSDQATRSAFRVLRCLMQARSIRPVAEAVYRASISGDGAFFYRCRQRFRSHFQ